MAIPVAAAAVLAVGLLVPLSIEHDAIGSVDCGSALAVDDTIASVDAASSCEDAAVDRRTVLYLVSGAIGGIGLIVLAFSSQEPYSRRNRHPFF